MKAKIFTILLGCLVFTACSEEFLTRDLDKGRYVPDGYYTTEARAEQALASAYGTMNGYDPGFGRYAGCFFYLNNDEFYLTANGGGWDNWGSIGLFSISGTFQEVQQTWATFYTGAMASNVALEVMPLAKEADPTFTQEALDRLMGQAYLIRAWNYYCLYTWFPKNRIIIKDKVETDPGVVKGPSTPEEVFAFIEADLKRAQDLLKNGLNTTSGYARERVTRGTAAALLGKLYMMEGKYAEAAAEFAKILPGSDGSYGTYALVDYRRNFTRKTEDLNNSESILEFQYGDTGLAGNNMMNWVFQNFTMNRVPYGGGSGTTWWNFAAPPFHLDQFESWTEGENTVYDYRAYETFWGVPNGASYTNDDGSQNAGVYDWKQQNWRAYERYGTDDDDVSHIIEGIDGSYGLRKYYPDSHSDRYTNNPDRGVTNMRIIRLADVILLYAECMANLYPSNVDPASPSSALHWVDMIRNRANQPMNDQEHLYSARPGVQGQLPSAAELMNAKNWTPLELVKHERFVEGFGEGWRREDLIRWKVGADFVKYKSGWQGYQSLILPVPQAELDNNPEMPKTPN